MQSETTGNSDAPRKESTGTETPLADTLAAAQAEVERLERQSAADHIEIDYADELGGASIKLNYHDLGGDD